MAEFTKAEDDGNTLSIEGVTKEGKTYSLKMDKATGILSDYTVDGKVVLEKGPVPSFWRAQNYNDTPIAYNRNLRNTDDNMELVDSPVITQDENRKHIRVALNVKLPVDAEQTLLYDIYGDGEIVVRSAFIPRSKLCTGYRRSTGTAESWCPHDCCSRIRKSGILRKRSGRKLH